METLKRLHILDTPPEERFDRLTRMAKRLFGVSIALVTLVDANRQWFKSNTGTDVRELPRDVSFCGHTILGDDILLIPDTLKDERFFDNPVVVAPPHIRFYAGCPLKVGAAKLGTLCIIDTVPRDFTAEDRQLLKDLAEMAEQELVAVQMATTDELTSLSNRRGFEALAQHTLNVCKRMQKPATLLFFDLDDFKKINDSFGHAEGDRALKTFSAALLQVFRDSDVIGRLGGDEFVVLLSDAGDTLAAAILPRLTERIEEKHQTVQHGYAIRFSVGRAQYDPARHGNISDLLAEADAAMYSAKRQARPDMG
jgi:diguanylate cyclase (GGDEF)-like protein